MENYPVYIDGAQCGSMQVYSEGLMTVFDAECRCVDRLVRWRQKCGFGRDAAGKGKTAPCKEAFPSANAHFAAGDRLRSG